MRMARCHSPFEFWSEQARFIQEVIQSCAARTPGSSYFFTDVDPFVSVGSIIATAPSRYVWRCHLLIIAAA